MRTQTQKHKQKAVALCAGKNLNTKCQKQNIKTRSYETKTQETGELETKGLGTKD